MKKQITNTMILIMLLFFNKLALAEWYEVNGHANYVSSKEAARVHALEDAIYQAMKFSGADISTLGALRPYLEEKRSEYQFSNHEVRYIRVLNSKSKNGNTVLRVQLDIYPSATGCHTSQYKKTLLVENIGLASPQQAVMGKIYDIGDDFSHIVNRQLDQESISFVSVGTTDYDIDKRNSAMLKMVAQDFNAQYIIGGTITDITATVEQNRLKSDTTSRQFALEIQVYDGKTGQEIYTRAYREVAIWDFQKTSQVDTRSSRFWTSTYGKMLLRVSRNIMLDLEAELSCKITLPEVVAIRNNKVTMSLGRLHGVQVGDKLQLWHTGSFIDQMGLPRNRVSQSEITLTVTKVYNQEAELTVDQPQLTQSIQIGDVMHREIR